MIFVCVQACKFLHRLEWLWFYWTVFEFRSTRFLGSKRTVVGQRDGFTPRRWRSLRERCARMMNDYKTIVNDLRAQKKRPPNYKHCFFHFGTSVINHSGGISRPDRARWHNVIRRTGIHSTRGTPRRQTDGRKIGFLPLVAAAARPTYPFLPTKWPYIYYCYNRFTPVTNSPRSLYYIHH
jgi:hypothetical protein